MKNKTFDTDDPGLISIIDDLPLWSAPFGLALLGRVRYRPGIKALDIGCGLGFPLVELAQRLGASSEVHGIDPWEAALDRVRYKVKKLGLSNVMVRKAKAEKLPFEDGFFDLIVSNNGLNNVENIEASLSECGRVIRHGGQMAATMNLPETMKEFYDVYRSVLLELGKQEEIAMLEEHIYAKRKPLSEIESRLAAAGFDVTNITQDSFTLRFTDATAMLGHLLIRLAFLKPWTGILREKDVPDVFGKIEQRLNALSGKQDGLALTIPFACIDSTRR